MAAGMSLSGCKNLDVQEHKSLTPPAEALQISAARSAPYQVLCGSGKLFGSNLTHISSQQAASLRRQPALFLIFLFLCWDQRLWLDSPHILQWQSTNTKRSSPYRDFLSWVNTALNTHNPWITDHLHCKSHAMLKKIHHVLARKHTKACFPEHYSKAYLNTLHACSHSFVWSEVFSTLAFVFVCGMCIWLLSEVSISELAPRDFGTELQKTAKFIRGPKYADLPVRNVLMQYEVDVLIPLFSRRTFFSFF